MDGWKKLHEKRPQHPLLYVIMGICNVRDCTQCEKYNTLLGLNLRFKLVYFVFSSVLYFLTYTQCCRFDVGFDRLAHYGRAATDGRVLQRSLGGPAGGRASSW
jgi:hypothetical protein